MRLTPLAATINVLRHVSHPLEAIGKPVLKRWLTSDSGHGPLPQNKTLLSLLQVPVHVLSGFDVHRKTGPFNLVTFFFT